MRPQLTYENISRAPILRILILSLSITIPGELFAQGASVPKSPREVLQAYRKMDSEGERLTTSGWYRASRFFVKPERPPHRKIVEVIEAEAIEDHPRTIGNRARVWLNCSAVGQIDSSGRFTSLISPSLLSPSGQPLRQPAGAEIRGPAPLGREYDLVLTDTYWEFTAARDSLRESKGPPEWRIETFEFEQWVTIETAIRYLTGLRDESSSELTRRNAETSIAALRRLLKR